MTLEQLQARVEEFAKRLETLSDSNTDKFLDQRLCCSGHHCGCMGATVGEYLAHQLREFVSREEV